MPIVAYTHIYVFFIKILRGKRFTEPHRRRSPRHGDALETIRKREGKTFWLDYQLGFFFDFLELLRRSFFDLLGNNLFTAGLFDTVFGEFLQFFGTSAAELVDNIP